MGFGHFLKEVEGELGFFGVNAVHCKANVDEHPIADAGFDGMVCVNDAGYVDGATNAANIDDGEFLFQVANFENLSGNA
jgi:hypothetical protein